MRQPECISQYCQGQFTTGNCPICKCALFMLVGHVMVVHRMSRKAAIQFLARNELDDVTLLSPEEIESSKNPKLFDALARYKRRILDGQTELDQKH